MYKAILTNKEEVILNDYKLFDKLNNEPENYNTAKYEDFEYLIEVFDDENGHPTINGVCLQIQVIVSLNAL